MSAIAAYGKGVLLIHGYKGRNYDTRSIYGGIVTGNGSSHDVIS